MKCPLCQSETKVINSRPTQTGITRRRECPTCLTRFRTKETLVIESMDKHLQELYFAKNGGEKIESKGQPI